ncbi:hypothetical protein LVJ82_03760 [Vitreoscilla massiliensis]|uniref:Uncharacterized protein n=1 Tax=Vitreoscilla massiliensis TaxID=1689272 RepID=A0ABY4E2X9_9NEIS|nr:hypothetical protein [Vitreoscilla massiliensis]UOO90113.1 hypothetical protein LVJ82_03760 [Vitreoscilla massiliensis]
MNQPLGKPRLPTSNHIWVNRYQEPPRGDFVVFLEKMLAAQQAKLKATAATRTVLPPVQPEQTQQPNPSAQSPSIKTATNKRDSGKKRFKTAAANTTPTPAQAWDKSHLVWLVASIVLTIIVPPLGGVMLLWALAKMAIFKLKHVQNPPRK